MKCSPICLALLAALFTLPISAQVAIGAPPFATMATVPEGQLDLANLNLQMVIPIVAKAGAGMPFSYALVYNSAVWSPAAGTWQLAGNLGWNAATNLLTGYESYQATSNQCGYGYPTQMYNFTIYGGFEYTDPFGAQHSFPLVIQYPTGNPCGPQYPSSGTATATDGSGYTLTASTSGSAPTVSLSSASGQSVSAPLFLAGSPITAAAGSITDPNSNNISADGSGNFYDTLGLKALSVSGSQSPNGSMTFTYSVAGGATTQVVVKFGSYSVRTNFGCSGVSEYSASSVPLVSEIDLPDGTSYTFSYEATPGYSGDVTARIASIKLPTGGTISYAYSGGSNGIVCADGSTATMKRTMPDSSQWTYAHSESGTAWTTAITDPQSNVTNYSFQGIYQTERQMNSGPSTTLETVLTCYNGAAAPCNSTTVTPPITEQVVTTQTDTNLESSVVTSYNGYGLPTEVDEHGWGSGAVGSLLRKTLTQYASLGAIVDRPSSIQVLDGGGTQRALTNYTYDSRGNTLTVSRWVSGSNSDTTTYTVNSNGTVATAKDPRGYTTTYSYGSGSCNGAFPTNVTLPNSLQASVTWDCSLAMPTQITDPNAQALNLHYGSSTAPDPFGGITQIDAPGTAAGSPTETVIQYSDQSDALDIWASTTSDSLPPADNGYRHERYVADGLGRKIKQYLVNDPSGEAEIDTTYNTLGEVASVTNPYRSTTDPTYGVTEYSYDPLGRATAITNPDNSQVSLYYGSQVGSNGGLPSPQCSGVVAYPVLAKSAAGRLSQVWLDAGGNVLEADEPNPSSGSLTSGGYATCYAYTTLDQLATVSQGGQQRSLDYDGIGELLYSRFPEASATISGPTDPFGNSKWSEALTYDSDGSVATREDANGTVTTFGYDSINRLTSETFSDGTPGRYFIYDSTSGCTLPGGANVTYPKGRMVCAGISGSNPAQYSLSSYDPAGDVIQSWDQGPSPAPLTTQDYSYFLNGQFSSYTNPNGNVFTYSLDNPGRVAKIVASSNWNNGETVLGNASFTPLETLASATVGPESIAASYNKEAEISETTASVGGTKDFDRLYTYDNDGLVASDNDGINSAYNRSYGHDFLSRLISITAPNTPSADSSFVYDRWGNLYQATGSESWNVSISGSTNQITTGGFSYDSDGRLTRDGNGVAYGWNAPGLMTSYNPGTASTYTYDAFGRRVRAVTPGGTFDYDYDVNGALRGVWNESNGTWKQLEIGVGAGTLETYNWTPPAGYSNFTYTGTSLLGSTAFRYNPGSGGIAKNYHFLPYGLEWPGESTDATTNLKWTGHELDSESGLYHFLFRNYSPLENRWLVPDPAGLEAADPVNPQTSNRYSYLTNAPLASTDPLGLFDPAGCDPFDPTAPCLPGCDPVFGCIPPIPIPIPVPIPIPITGGPPEPSPAPSVPQSSNEGNNFTKPYPCLTVSQILKLRDLLLQAASQALGAPLSNAKLGPIIGGAQDVYANTTDVVDVLAKTSPENPIFGPMFERGYSRQLIVPAPRGLPGPGKFIHILYTSNPKAPGDIKIHADIGNPQDVVGAIGHLMNDVIRARRSSAQQGGCAVKFN